jgi:hypothetical protein
MKSKIIVTTKRGKKIYYSKEVVSNITINSGTITIEYAARDKNRMDFIMYAKQQSIPNKETFNNSGLLYIRDTFCINDVDFEIKRSNQEK